jgi:CTP synthase (UTP-ammonia lyase)
MLSAIRVGLIGESNDRHKAHGAIPGALEAAGGYGIWVSTDSIGDENTLDEFEGLWCVPGMPYRSEAGALRAIQYARTRRVPFLGTSAGFQHALVEFARNELGLLGAGHQKTDPKAAVPLIAPLVNGMLGMRARVRFTPGSRLQKAYGTRESIEEYHCSFGLNERYRRILEGRGMMVAAVDDQDDVRGVELEGHPFFVATLFQPELQPNSPVVKAFIAACEKRRNQTAKAAS